MQGSLSKCDCGYDKYIKANDGPVLGPEWSRKVLRLHYPTCAGLLEWPIVPHLPEIECGKCLSRSIDTTYHEARWYFRRHDHDYWRTDLYVYSCPLTIWYRPVEHLDRRCATCGFTWLESVFHVFEDLSVERLARAEP